MNFGRKPAKQTGNQTSHGFAVPADNVAFVKEFWVHLGKAVNSTECPPKEKHVRFLILGSHSGGGSNLLLQLADRLGMQASPIVCWKFLYVLFRVLRDGPDQSLKESQPYSARLKQIGAFWRSLREGYGPLLAAKTSLIAKKLAFHGKYTSVSGTLNDADDQLSKFPVNQVVVDLFAYIEAHLAFSTAVLNSLDRARSTSVTERGQCKLIPLVISVQECTVLYDYIVKTLFRLHGHNQGKDSDELANNRQRFTGIFQQLKTFFDTVANLQYIKSLIQVPSLGDPPNFVVPEGFKAYQQSGALQAALLPSNEDTTDEVEEPFDPRSDEVAAAKSAKENVPESADPWLPADQAAVNSAIEPIISQSTADVVWNSASWESPEKNAWVSLDETDLDPLPSPPKPAADSSENSVEKLLVDNERLKDDLKRLTRDWEARMQGLQTELNSLRADKTAKRPSTVDDSVIEAHPRFSQLRAAFEALREKFAKLKELYVALQKDHVASLRSNSELRARLTELQNLNEKLTADLELATKSAHASSCADQEALLNELTKYKLDIESHAAKCAELQAEVDELKRSKDKLAAAAVEESNSAAAELINCKTECTGLQTRLKEVEASLVEHAESRSHAQSEVEQLETTVGRLNTENSSLLLQLRSCESRTDELNRTINSFSFRHFLELLLDHIAQSTETRFKNLFVDETETHGRSTSEVSAMSDTDNARSDDDATISLARAAASVLDLLAQLRKMNRQEILSHRETFVRILLQLYDLIESILHDGSRLRFQSVQQSDELNNLFRSLRTHLPTFFGSLAQIVPDSNYPAGTDGTSDSHVSGTDAGEDSYNAAFDTLMGVLSQLHLLVSTLSNELGKQTEDLAGTLEAEIAQAQRQVEFIAGKLTELLAAQRGSQQSALQIEVNEKILGACNQLMLAIIVLIEKSRIVQAEIAYLGEQKLDAGGQFYKKHHRWTEGLISAAKAVGWSANYLFECADKLMKEQEALGNEPVTATAAAKKRSTAGSAKTNRRPRFEQLIVCSQDISASTMQLVLASRVKADPSSQALAQLIEASKQIQLATANVVATTKACLDLLEYRDATDFSGLTLTQMKRLEMDSQVRIIELQSQLQKEQHHLGELRKLHYQLADENEGLAAPPQAATPVSSTDDNNQ